MSITILGTSHISQESVNKVKEEIEKNNPEIVAIELDKNRAHALLHNHKPKLSFKMVKTVGVKGFMFYVVAGFIQRKLGRIVGVDPGSEMKAALITAIQSKKKLALIDQDMSITLHKLSKSLGWKERFRFVWDIVAAPFSKELKPLRQMDLRKVPDAEVIEQILIFMEKRYPNVYRVLVSERNEFMAARLIELMHKYPDENIIAVVGAAHQKEMQRIITEKMKEGTHTFSVSQTKDLLIA